MKLVVHVGAHKTATTFLQNNMRDNLEIIDRAGIYFVDKKADGAARLFKKYSKELLQDNCQVEVLQKILHRLVEPALLNKRYHTVFISEENLIGHMLSPRGGFYPHASTAAAAVKGLEALGKVKIMLTVRRQDTYIESCYLFRKVRECRESTRSIYDFLAKVDLGSLSWQPLVRAFVGSFGQQNCVIRPFELIKQDADGFARGLLGEFMDSSKLALRTKPSNPSLSKKALRILNLIDDSSIELTAAERFEVGHAMYSLFRDPSYKRPIVLHDFLREDILRRYEHDNRELFRRYMPDLDQGFYSPEPSVSATEHASSDEQQTRIVAAA